MPETKAQRSEAARRGAATRKAHELQNTQEQHDLERKQQERVSEVVDRTSELSEDVLKSLESGSRAAIEAVRKFVDVVDEALPALPHGHRPSRRREIVDAAMDMADRFVKSQYQFLRSVVHSLGRPSAERKTKSRAQRAPSASGDLRAYAGSAAINRPLGLQPSHRPPDRARCCQSHNSRRRTRQSRTVAFLGPTPPS